MLSRDMQIEFLKFLVENKENRELVYKYLKKGGLELFDKLIQELIKGIFYIHNKYDFEVIKKPVLIDLIKNSEEFDLYVDIIDEIYSTPRILDDEELLKVILSELKNLKLIEFITKTAKDIEKGKFDFRKIYKELEEIELLKIEGDGLTNKNVDEAFKKLQEKYDESKGNIIPTPFKKLNECLYGGFGSGEVHMLMGMPKTGKSTLGAFFGAYVLTQLNKSVIHITLELKEEDVFIKYVSAITGIPQSYLIKEAPKDIRDRIKNLVPFYIKHYPNNTITTLDISMYIRRLLFKENLDIGLIIIDYDDLLNPTKDTGSMYENAGVIYSDMIKLADKFNAPVLTFAQPRREAWNKLEQGKIMKAIDVSHSAMKIHKCWSLTSINRYSADNYVLYLDMARRGISGVEIPLKVDLSRCKFEELVVDDYE